MCTLVDFRVTDPKSKWIFGLLDHTCVVLADFLMEFETKLSICSTAARSQLRSDFVSLSSTFKTQYQWQQNWTHWNRQGAS